MNRTYLFFILIFLFVSCQRIEQIKSKLSKDLEKADSIVNMAVDSISSQVLDTVSSQEDSIENSSLAILKEKDELEDTYTVLLNSISSKDRFLLHQLTYFDDSLFLITMQGIFQVLSFSPLESLYDFLLMDVSQEAWKCQIDFSFFPDIEKTEILIAGCFARKLDKFYKFSAIIELAREANLPLDPIVVKKAKEVENKVSYEVLNSYLGWTFYFTRDNGKFYLVAIDFNQY